MLVCASLGVWVFSILVHIALEHFEAVQGTKSFVEISNVLALLVSLPEEAPYKVLAHCSSMEESSLQIWLVEVG